jgi:hypothetical protein
LREHNSPLEKHMPAIAPQPVQLTCPNCGTAFRTGVYTLVDAGEQPELKQALLAGQLNLAVCPNCGTASMLGTPLIYHDANKQLFLVYFPQELNASPAEQERYVGDATSFLMRGLPAEAPRAHLLNPRRFLTLASLMEAILEADGITKEMVEAQRLRIDLISQLAEALPDEEQFAALVQERRAEITPELFAMISAFVQAAPPAQRDSQQMLVLLLSRLQEVLGLDAEGGETGEGEYEAELAELIEKLRVADDEVLETIVAEQRHLIDYSFFEAWTEQIDAAEAAGDDDTAEQLTNRRARILQIVEDMDRQTQEMFEAGNTVLRDILAAPDPVAAMRANSANVNDALILALSANIAAAQRSGNSELIELLGTLSDTAAQIIEERLTPEDRFINELLNAETPQDSTRLLRKNVVMIKPDFVKRLNELADQEGARGNQPTSERLRQMAREAGAMLF